MADGCCFSSGLKNTFGGVAWRGGSGLVAVCNRLFHGCNRLAA
jgi:hypothetical protein